MKRFICNSFIAVLAGHIIIVLSASAGADSFTFVVWSDTHYGYNNDLGYRDDSIGDINGLPGTAYPAPFAGVVDTVAFVVHAGDITQDGALSQWQNTTPSTNDDYVSGRALLNCPVYEVMGNHDHYGGEIRPRIVEEHGNPWYSFDHGDVHFVMLDSCDGAVDYEPYFRPEQLAWLTADLAAAGTTRPVIVVTHYPPWNDDPDQFGALGDTLAGYNIAAILHGHLHETDYYVWRGWDVWGTGDVQYAQGNPYSTISVVRIARGRLQAISYNWWLNAWYPDLYLDKPITGLPLGSPRIFLNPTTINVTTPLGVGPAPSTFTVTNVGDLTLNYTITDDADWLSTAPESGSSTDETDTIQATYNVAGLHPGLHTATITVSDTSASNSPQTVSVSLRVQPLPGDFDGDEDIDQEDFGHLQACLSGAGIPQNDPACRDARLDADEDVDGYDVLIFKRCMSGAHVPIDANCAS